MLPHDDVLLPVLADVMCMEPAERGLVALLILEGLARGSDVHIALWAKLVLAFSEVHSENFRADARNALDRINRKLN